MVRRKGDDRAIPIPFEPVPNGRLWAATGPENDRIVFLECERFFDARRVAEAIFQAPSVSVTLIESSAMRRLPLPRTQVRWTGTAASRVPTLTLETREVGGTPPIRPWQALR